jgi:hypothetical protein
MSKHHKLAGVNYRKIWEQVNGPIPVGYHIHHKDGNPYNNSIDNLECLSAEEHMKIHKKEFILWASVGGKKGGDKCKENGLGFFNASPELRKQRSDHARKHIRYDLFSGRIKSEYKNGRKHWTEYYTKEEVSEKISKGDPGKSKRGKKAWNNGIKMSLSDPELARKRKSEAALKREKFLCECCGKMFDAGNLKQHKNRKKEKKCCLVQKPGFGAAKHGNGE